MLRDITAAATRASRRRGGAFQVLALSALITGSINLGLTSLWSEARAAEPTTVADAAEENNPFDFIGEIFYRRHLRRAKITREYNCNPGPDNQDIDTCPGAPPGGQIINVKELRYARYTHELVPRARFGLYQDLELWIEAPIVVEDSQEVRFAGDGGDPDGIPVTSAISSISPNGNGREVQQLFRVPDGGFMSGLPRRAGFGDMVFKLRYAAISHERDETRGDWVIEVGYRAPTGDPMRARPSSGVGGVGRGVHELLLSTAFSRRYKFVEPYARFEASLPFGSVSRSPFQEYTGSQEYVLPGARGRFDFGAEMILYNPNKDTKLYLDIGLGAGYQAEGRDYSELFDALAVGAASCNPNAETRDGRDNCATYNPNARFPGRSAGAAPELFDGVTTVEQFATVRGHLGFGFYASRYFKFGAQLSLAHETEHNLSNAEIGKDIYNQGEEQGVFVPATTDAQRSEHNPTFVPAIDSIGRRLRIEETTVFSLAVNMSFFF